MTQPKLSIFKRIKEFLFGNSSNARGLLVVGIIFIFLGGLFASGGLTALAISAYLSAVVVFVCTAIKFACDMEIEDEDRKFQLRLREEEFLQKRRTGGMRE